MEINDEAVICPKCGVSQQSVSTEPDNGGFGWGLLGFCIPLVGLILFLVWKDTKPKTSKVAGKGALISVIFWVVVYVLLFALGFAGAMMSY